MGSESFIFEARVTAVFPEERTLNAQWCWASDHQIFNARMIMSPGNFSFPQVGEIVLIIGGPSSYYCLGKFDSQYKVKLGLGKPDAQGNPAVVKLGDGTEIGDKLKAKKVYGGETVLGNLAKGTWLLLSNSRNFSLIGGVNEGIKYIYNAGKATVRTLQLLGQTIVNNGSGQITTLGAVTRFFPGIGNFIAKNPLTQQGAVEATTTIYDTLTTLAKATLKLGDIFIEPITSQDTGILQPHTEIGAAGAATWLNAMLAVFNAAGLEVSSIKIDNAGNMSINTPLPGTGKLVINSGLNTHILSTLGTYIGGSANVPPIEPMVLGQQLYNWLSTHKHPTGTGPSGVPTPDDIATLATILSPLNRVD